MELFELFKKISNDNIIKYVLLFIIIIIIGHYYNHPISYYFIIIIIYLFIIYNIQMKWFLEHETSNNYDDHINKQLNITEENVINKEYDIKLFLHEMIFISYYSLDSYNKLILLIEKYIEIYNYIIKDIDILKRTSSIEGNKLSINQKRILVRDLNNLKNVIIEKYNNMILILPNNKRVIEKYNKSIKILIDLLNRYYNDIINIKDIDNLIEINYINSYNYDDKMDNML